MYKLFISLAVLVLVVCLTFFYYMVGIDHVCNNLKSVASDEVVAADLWDKITLLLDEQSRFKSIGKPYGTIYAQEMEDYFGINWEALQIPLRHATVGVYGERVDYRDFNKSSVEEVRIGFGYRKYLSFKIAQPVTISSEIPLKYSKLEVVCEGD